SNLSQAAPATTDRDLRRDCVWGVAASDLGKSPHMGLPSSSLTSFANFKEHEPTPSPRGCAGAAMFSGRVGENNSMSSERSRPKSAEHAQSGSGLKRRDLLLSGSSLFAASALAAGGLAKSAQAQQQVARPAGQRPNILFIMGDDVGWFNVGAYH